MSMNTDFAKPKWVSLRRCGRDRLLEATQEGLLDPQTVVNMCARWLTSDEVYEMCDHNEINLARLIGD